MLALSIDHSFNRTGYSVIDENKVLRGTGSFELGKMTYENILEFRDEIRRLVLEYKPTVVVTEKPAHMRNVNIARMLSGLHTEVILEAIRNNIAYAIVNPKTVKKHIAGHGSATKEEVMEAMILKYDFDRDMLCFNEMSKKKPIRILKTHYDESDSVANAITYLNLGGE